MGVNINANKVEIHGDVFDGNKNVITNIDISGSVIFPSDNDKEKLLEQLSDFEQKLKDLKEKVDSTEDLPNDEKKALIKDFDSNLKTVEESRKAAQSIQAKQKVPEKEANRFKKFVEGAGNFLNKVNDTLTKSEKFKETAKSIYEKAVPIFKTILTTIGYVA
jgi:DNA repair exonuclease SbcCD ATPase subunit